jgi:hypothetical protein
MNLLRRLPIVLILFAAAAASSSAAVRVEQLITDLAAESFSAREEATRLFLEQDPRVIPLVRNLVQTTEDAEVKQRAKRILMVLEERDLDARLQAFMKDTDEKQGVSLPGWKQFRQVAGSSQAARDLFVEMQRAESKLLLLYDTFPEKVPDAMAQQLMEQTLIITTASGTRTRSTPKSGSVATYWFLAGEPDLKIGGDAASGIVRLYHMSAVSSQLASQETLKTLFVRWVLRETEPMVMMQNLSYAQQLNLPEVGVLAERVVTSSLQPSLRVSGLGTLIKTKKKAALPVLEKALADEGITYQFFPNGIRAGERPKEPYKIQFRDLALVQMMGLCGQKPADFGLLVPLPTEANLYQVEYQKLLLATDEEREALHKKWRAWWDEHKAEYLAEPMKPTKT